ncbi:MAG: 4-hydroxythreonine-4-phosphate dehydrogenase PdxA, partial [Victivallaceae bacterium]
VKVGKLLNEVIRSEGIAHPKLVAAGINPHAGEDGFMGREDEDIVKPALAALRESGIEIAGPLPSDTLFVEKIRSQYDGIISMYHDQGHIPFKMLAFDRGVNSTLGIPIIRCSVDHGTAFEIAWRGVADIGSMLCAMKLAYLRAAHRKIKKD